MKNQIKNGIIFGISTFLTLFVCFVGYAAITNIWTNTSELEVSSGSTLSADSWNKLLGNFEFLKSEINKTPIVGSWVQITDKSGVGNFVWEQQLIDTSGGIFGWSAGQNYITINESGYYEISVAVTGGGLSDNQRQDARLFINRDGMDIRLSSGLGMGGVSQTYYTHHLRDIGYFQSGDKVYVDISSGGRFGNSTGRWSKLTIKKL